MQIMSKAIGNGRPIEVLLIEDNPGDTDLVREGLKEGTLRNVLHVVGDGEEAMAFLKRVGKYAEVPQPDLILLDLNLPRKDGREVLAEIKADKKLKRIPVVVLTSSQAEEDIVKSYQLHANCYIPKPIGFAEFVKIVQAIESFWFTTVRLPAADTA
jgi:CheY-like chemotaxis protein